MVEKRNLANRSHQAEKTDLWKEYPDYYRQLKDAHLWPLWEEIHKFTARPSPPLKSPALSVAIQRREKPGPSIRRYAHRRGS